MTSGLKIAGFAAAMMCASAAGAALFEPMFTFTSVKGDVRVFKPGAAESVPALKQHAYPYGSRIIVPKWDGKDKATRPGADVVLSKSHWFNINDSSDLSILDAAEKPADNKIIDMRNGKIMISVGVGTYKPGGEEKDALVEAGISALSLRTPNGTVISRITEKNTITVGREDGLIVSRILPEGGTLEITGPQYKLRQIKRNAEIEIAGDKDFTRITSIAGEFNATIEKGLDATEEVPFRQRTNVKIWRSYASIGGKMAVSVMIVPPSGAIKSYAFLEGESATSSPTFAAQTTKDDTTVTDDFGSAPADEIEDSSASENDSSEDDGFFFNW